MENETFKIKISRLRKKIITDDIIALRKMRIFRKIPREVAAQSVGISPKTMERFENGRTTFPEERKKALIRRYRYSLQEYSDILDGKMVLPELPARSIYRIPNLRISLLEKAMVHRDQRSASTFLNLI
ncbi:MAG: hypothetical protein A2504_14675 [Bdellovibrionales bacterium RIFOXYD12_FULL_39_22]|nr:MAG: hypothetical protein A2385_10140 [Bdellovibrionales bacterium RIFOXYB1_FULL_39_21]OFZ44365.1 MAG: hypothetical protein A2404_10910 [Bdellovibrionales bacterium RIFOXYC1_FULL_39_130]OFZ74112.1 MAG: hypothetical protein A2560_03575 [Bdellovibrionales bacterium RIFOXYD1_FULL_39_84]OFZ91961.1 MAG: hypothetical protein A2504_14675 [Bdellovibrionales bacterium RIFOXYD12_FULL_39_22]HLE12276.1 hypothetical protein [Bacteriovoracaceae bacterium]